VIRWVWVVQLYSMTEDYGMNVQIKQQSESGFKLKLRTNDYAGYT
jgi:hypothetical protein